MYHPVLGLFLQRDPLPADNEPVILESSLYGYANNSPLDGVDPFGLRTVTIEILYLFGANVVKANLKKIQEEVERIFQECFKKRCKTDKAVIVWTKIADDKSYDEARKKHGFSGGNAFGYYPAKVVVGIQDSESLPTFGQTGKYAAVINPNRLITFAEQRRVTAPIAIGLTIAHELGLHAIGQKAGHFHDVGFVDAAAGKPGGVFSDEACDLIIDQFGVK